MNLFRRTSFFRTWSVSLTQKVFRIVFLAHFPPCFISSKSIKYKVFFPHFLNRWSDEPSWIQRASSSCSSHLVKQIMFIAHLLILPCRQCSVSGVEILKQYQPNQQLVQSYLWDPSKRFQLKWRRRMLVSSLLLHSKIIGCLTDYINMNVEWFKDRGKVIQRTLNTIV